MCNKITICFKYTFILAIIVFIFSVIPLRAQDNLYVGWAVADIAPEKPAAIVGSRSKRVSESVQDPLNAIVLAMETRGESGRKEQAIMVSCDILLIRRQTQKKLQRLIEKKLPDFDASKLFLSATHTHSGPGLIDGEFFGFYDGTEDEGVLNPSEYEIFFIEKTADAVVKAWKGRKAGGFSWGLGNAVLAHNRRTVKLDGTARMYGVNDPYFSHYEGTQDDRVQMLFFWDTNKSLTGIVINTASTAQAGGAGNNISADFFHEARQTIKKKYGEDIFVFFQVGAAGDLTPVVHEYTYRRAENIMLERKGITFRKELANRILRAVDEVMPHVKNDIEYKTIFKHTAVKVNLPVIEPPSPPFYMVDDVNPAEFHVIRLGDIAIATNPFEPFIDYGILIKAKSKAVLTFIVQLSCHHSGYLPTERAVAGGGYSADEYLVGPEGGYILVNETIKHVNYMWDE